ncbi:hypothetical protein Rsub_02487 [Raphidocelis subcapitata]|uniref:FAD/NAD(P)-binding domain-containing protein n=1 Tax=Raphidocelis subcapitata TaxID=307507 RepID=A0A2V0NRW9_9CHLO|nr:hypothetical protein Rsub_02487 [Raphidocelis subcapitata]|eukprot:GBF90381.1 hypothetical protein Rsub_02487 [Raphidocelis subcapitata]
MLPPPAPPSSLPRRRRVLVIGAGFAGAHLAIDLAARGGLDVTLVDRKPYFEVVFANARALVEPAVCERSVIGVEELKPHGTFVCGEVVSLTDREAALADGRKLPFDYAAVCTGSAQALWKGDARGVGERREELRAQHAALRAAPAVVVVGGGPLGVELAGEILTDLPGKPVVVVHSGPRLLQDLPCRAGALARGWLEAHGCKVLLNDRVAAAAEPPGAAKGGEHGGGGIGQDGDGKSGGGGGARALRTERGEELPAGALLLWAVGARPATGFAAPALGGAVGEDGLIKVSGTLQVEGHPHIFALGDACSIPESKLAFLATGHAGVAARNIAALAAADAAADGGGGGGGAGAPQLAEWRPGMGLPRLMLVTVGRSWGITAIGSVAVGGWLASRVKSIAGFVEKTRRAVCAAP